MTAWGGQVDTWLPVPPRLTDLRGLAPVEITMGRYVLDEEVQRQQAMHAIQALRETMGNVNRAAAMLNLPRRTFYEHLKRYSINPNDYRPEGYRTDTE